MLIIISPSENCFEESFPRGTPDYYRKSGLFGDDVIVVAPKNSGIKRARSLAEYLESAIAIVDYEDDDKNRENGYVIGNVSGKKVILIDDILNTGVTFANAANVVREAGASEIYAVASHGLFTSGAAKSGTVNKLSTGISKKPCTWTA